MILFDSVSKCFCRKDGTYLMAVKDISLHIPKGITVGLIGPSGAGKTTFLKLVCGLLAPDAGRVKTMRFNPVKDRGRLAGNISVLFADNSALQAEETVLQNLLLIKDTYGIPKKEFSRQKEELTEAFGLSQYLSETVKNLSLGFRRRAELAAAFLVPADLFLLDEPCIGMDERARISFEKVVRQRQKAGRTILLSSHTMGEIDSLAGRILLLKEGQVLFYGEREGLYRQLAPVNRMAVSFANRLPDMQDVPFIRYEAENLDMKINYNANHVTAAELLETFLQSGEIREITMGKPTLEDVITETVKRRV